MRAMTLRLRRWQWAILAVLFAAYVVWATWGVYGGFYIGYPPYTPAYLNNTRRAIVRTVNLERPTRLRMFGALTVGRVKLLVDGEELAEFVGRFNRGFTLAAGRREIRIENEESAGWVNYELQ